MSIGRICIRDVDTANADETVLQAAERMHERAVGTLVVVSDARTPIGIVTDRDLVQRVLARGLHPLDVRVGEVMTGNLKTISEDSPIESALALMRTGRFRRLPVVDKRQHLIGLVSLDDILQLLAEEFADIGQLLRRESPAAVLAGA